jgi:hypothetical protein
MLQSERTVGHIRGRTLVISRLQFKASAVDGDVYLTRDHIAHLFIGWEWLGTLTPGANVHSQTIRDLPSTSVRRSSSGYHLN